MVRTLFKVAAYHQPASNGGDTDDYWLYPTRSNSAPGNTIGPLPLVNHANHRTTVYSVTQAETRDPNQNYLTEVGSYPGSVGFYGTYDQGGNVFEWNDAVITGTFRGLRGGTWANLENFLRSSSRNNHTPSLERSYIGFRVASD